MSSLRSSKLGIEADGDDDDEGGPQNPAVVMQVMQRQGSALGKLLQERWPRFEANVSRLAKRGWSLPMGVDRPDMEEALGCTSEHELDEWFVDFYVQNDGRALHELEDRVLFSFRTANWQLVLHEAFEAYRQRTFRIVIPALLAVIEGLVADLAGELHTGKKSVRQLLNKHVAEVPDGGMRGLAAAAAEAVVLKLFESSRFGGNEPVTLNRHWVLHGRSMNRVGQADCLRLFQLIDTLVSGRSEHERRRDELVDSLAGWASEQPDELGDSCSVILYGSLARGDFWIDRDVDLLVVGPPSQRSSLVSGLRVWGAAAGVEARKLEISDSYTPESFNRLVSVPPRQRTYSNGEYPLQLGVHGFDTAAHNILLIGNNLLDGFDFATGADLRHLAAVRLHDLVTGRLRSPNAIENATEALKAVTIYFSIGNGEAPTRDKRRIPICFERSVPEFRSKSLAVRIWEEYRGGGESPDDNQLEQFIEELDELVVADEQA